MQRKTKLRFEPALPLLSELRPEVAESGMASGNYFLRRYWSLRLIQSARGGVKTLRSTVSSTCLGFVRHIGRDAENFAGMNGDFFAVDPELQCAIEDVGELLVVMAVLGNDAAFFQKERAPA